jgi:hypothetical protein
MKKGYYLSILIAVLGSGLALGEAPSPASTTYEAGSEIAVILSKDRFFPSEIRVRAGIPSTFVFTTVNKKPAALVIEPTPETRATAAEKAPVAEITRELGNDRTTSISFDSPKGTYRFHDALGGGRGQIIVE